MSWSTVVRRRTWRVGVLALTLALIAALLGVGGAPTAVAAPFTWPTPIPVSTAGQDAYQPRVAVAPDGSTTAVWYRSDGSHDRVQTATRPPAGAWGTPVDLSAAGQDALYPQVATALDGTTAVVWRRSDGSDNRIQAAVRPPKGAWGAPVDLSAAGQDASSPQVATGPDGTITAVWYRSDGSDNRVQTVTRPLGGGWGTPVDLSAAGQNASSPQVATGPDGTTTATWYRSDGSNYRIRAANRPAAGAWGAPADLSAAGQDAFSPQVATGPDGTTTVWARSDGSSSRIQAAVRPDAGGAWSTPVDLSAAGQHASSPRVATGPDGTITTVWRRYDGSSYRIQTAVRPPRGAWGTPADLSAAGQSASSPQVATAPDGSSAVVWARYDGSHDRIQTAIRPAGGAWGTPADLSAPGQDVYDQQIAAGADGTVALVWAQGGLVTAVVADQAFPAPVQPVVRLKAKPKRDHTAPYTYRLTGRLTGPFTKNAANCSGRVMLVVRVKPTGKKAKQKQATLKPDCTFKTKIKIKNHKLGKLRNRTKVRLKIIARSPATTTLTPAKKARTVVRIRR